MEGGMLMTSAAFLKATIDEKKTAKRLSFFS